MNVWKEVHRKEVSQNRVATLKTTDLHRKVGTEGAVEQLKEAAVRPDKFGF
jgi:hypothetical protein